MKARWPIYVVAAPVMVAAWILFALTPCLHEQEGIQRQTADGQAQLADFSITTSQLPGILQTQQALDSSVHEFDSNLYAKQDILRLFDRIHEAATKCKIQLTEISPSVNELLALKRDLSNIGDPQFLNLTLKLTGDYLSFGSYVESLEGAPYFRGVNSCQISSAIDQIGPTTFTIGLKALLGRPQEKL